MNERIIANRYKIEEELGRGGMAVVYRSLDLRLNRYVALKLLHPFLATQPESAARFLRESEAIAKLHHPNIVEIFDAGSDEESGSYYLVMELVEGPTLGAFIQAHPTKIPEIALAMGCCLCDAVSHAHKAGIIHRDIKPENIMISADGVMKLMDFGIARILDAERMTASGSLVGSPAHMPPEIIEGQPYGFTVDIFSLGTVVYYLLTNVLPFQGNTPMTVFKAILDNNYAKPSRVCLTISKAIDKIVANCLQTDPNMRYQTPEALKQDLVPVLASVHFENYCDILSRYFTEPDKFNEAMLPVVKASLNESARLAVRERRLPFALEKLNCVLAYDPDDADAKSLLQRLRMGSVIKKRVLVGSGILAAILAIVLLVTWLGKGDEEPDLQGASQPHQIILTESSEVTQPSTGNAVLLTGNHIETPADQGSQIDERVSDIIEEIRGMGKILANAAQNPEDSGVTSENAAINPDSTGNSDSNAKTTNENAGALALENRDRGVKVKTPKKTQGTENHEKQDENTTAADDAQLAANTNEDQVNPNDDRNRDDKDKPKTDDTKVRITQPVFPPDAFAVINGQRYEANASGDIVMDLAPGKYKMTLSCAKRCVQHTEMITVEAGKVPRLDVVSLEWSDASLNLIEPDGTKVYFVARRLDDRQHRVFHLVPKIPNAVNGFNAFGKPVQLEVYAIPTSNTLKSFDVNALEQAKYASTRVSLEPGETRTVRF